MADFQIPFGRDGERRQATATEKTGGFPCGPADQGLFNGLQHDIEAEIGNVISFFGVTPSASDLTQLRQAIEAGIAAATGGGDTSQFLLVSQARARLPIFPEIVSADGTMNVTSPASGTVRVPGGVEFMHRGIFPVTTVETDFVTDISKTYHVRWSLASGYELLDLAAGGYNPSTLAEGDEAFDSTYDDMLIARVVTNSSNVATITNLVNVDRLFFNGVMVGSNWVDADDNAAQADFVQSLNWSRTPKFRSFDLAQKIWSRGDSTIGDHDQNVFQLGGAPLDTPGQFPVDRYSSSFTMMSDYSTTLRINLSLGA